MRRTGLLWPCWKTNLLRFTYRKLVTRTERGASNEWYLHEICLLTLWKESSDRIMRGSVKCVDGRRERGELAVYSMRMSFAGSFVGSVVIRVNSRCSAVGRCACLGRIEFSIRIRSLRRKFCEHRALIFHRLCFGLYLVRDWSQMLCRKWNCV